MSYCNINDAFKMGTNFDNTIRGLSSFNPINSTIENLKSSYNNLTCIKSPYE